MQGYQTLFMLLLTLAVGVMFLIKVPAPQDAEIAQLETMIAIQQATIQYLQVQPTAAPTATPVATLDAVGENPPPTSAPVPFLSPTPNLVTSPSGKRIVSVQTAREVSADGCAPNPITTFAAFDTIYGVVSLAEVTTGDALQVIFYHDTGGTLIYEESFTIQAPGSFCRWYVVEPDELGWDSGDYTVSYQLNSDPPLVATYTIAGGAAPPVSAEGDMMDEESGQ